MQAVILCGGKGTRLSTLYADRPKVLVPVAGRPFLAWQLDWLARGGVTAVHLAAGHLADVLGAWLQEQAGGQQAEVSSQPAGASGLRSQVSGFQFQVSRCWLRCTVSTEPAPLGTGGGLKYVEPFLASDPFLVLNGDSLMPRLDFPGLEKAHAAFARPGKSAGAATLAVTRIAEAGRYGTVEFDAAHRITAFREKASRTEGFINGGVYLMDRGVLAAISPGKNVSIETDTFPALAAAGRLQAAEFPQPLLDMGTPEGIRAMEEFLGQNA
jgi:NDP-sugar pyrophosphorylase family protein